MKTKAFTWIKVVAFVLGMLGSEVRRQIQKLNANVKARIAGPSSESGAEKNIVIVGASFAGWFATHVLANSLPPSSPYRIVVVEPNSHFQFSWVLPRFCVVQGHEDKAFIPYDRWRNRLPTGVVKWVKDWAVSTSSTHVKLRGGDEIPYEYLIIATGSGVDEGLPSRVNHTEKAEGVRRLREIQAGIKEAKKVVVVGGGAAGVEVATDTKDLYPDKKVTLVHSRDALMHRFGKELQDEAMEGMTRLGVEVILNERVVAADAATATVTLRSGSVVECDKFINCTGQKPLSGIIKDLSPSSVADTGHIRIKPTLQIADDRFPNIYVCGDVADTQIPTPNGRAATRQASVVTDNVLACVRGGKPSYEYKYSWPIDSFIKLTLGLHRSSTYLGDGNECLLWRSKEEKVELMVKDMWKRLNATPFEDDSYKSD